LARAMALIGAIPALVFVSGFTESNPWASFIIGMTILLSVFITMSYFDKPVLWNFFAVMAATLLITAVGLASNDGNGNVAVTATVSFFAAGPRSAVNLIRQAPWKKWAVIGTMVLVASGYLFFLWNLPQQLILY